MDKIIIATDRAPAAIGPYSQGLQAGGFVFTSGQLPVDMGSGALETADIKKATRNCLANIAAILAERNLTLDNIVKTTVFLTDMAKFADMNEAYAAYFEADAPARSCIEVAALPKGAIIEIEAIAAL